MPYFLTASRQSSDWQLETELDDSPEAFEREWNAALGVATRRRRPYPVWLTIVVPAYNERRTLRAAVESLTDLPLGCDYEVIVVDDGSTDGSHQLLAELSHPRVRVVVHDRNLGKGAAVRTGIAAANGTHLLVFDADMEYDPADIAALLRPVLEGDSEVVFGRRQGRGKQALRFAVANRGLTWLANALYSAQLGDLHTCLKLAPVSVLRQLSLVETGFGLDTEITCGLLRAGLTPLEVPISYTPRTRDEGKKINWRDGVRCVVLLCTLRLRPGAAGPPAVKREVSITLP